MTATDQLLARAEKEANYSDSRAWTARESRLARHVRDLAAALRTTETQRDAAYAVIRQMTEGGEVDPDWDPTEYGWTPAEAEAIAHATRSEP